MKLSDFIESGIDIQSEYKIVYYDYHKEERIEVSYNEIKDYSILYMYVENEILYIEVEFIDF